jgi:hypothetical protein
MARVSVAQPQVRQHLWTHTHVYMSPAKADMVEIPCFLLNRLPETLSYAA